jgi:hypothetical protein
MGTLGLGLAGYWLAVIKPLLLELLEEILYRLKTEFLLGFVQMLLGTISAIPQPLSETLSFPLINVFHL